MGGYYNITLSANDRFAGTSSDYMIQIGELGLGRDAKTFQYSFDRIHFLNSVTPINSYNNKFYIDEGAGTLEAVVPVGDYTATQFAVALAAALNALGGFTYTITYAPLTGKLLISSTGAVSLVLPGAIQDTCFLEAGFTAAGLGAAVFDGISAYEITSDGILDLSGSKVNYIEIRQFGKFGISTTANHTSICIPNDAPFGSLVEYKSAYPIWKDINISTFTALNITFYDEFGRTLPLASNTNPMINLILRSKQ